MKYLTTKQIIRDHDIDLRYQRTNETLRYLVSCAGIFPGISPTIAELVRIRQPIELDTYLNHLLNNSMLKQYEYAKLLVGIYL